MAHDMTPKIISARPSRGETKFPCRRRKTSTRDATVPPRRLLPPPRGWAGAHRPHARQADLLPPRSVRPGLYRGRVINKAQSGVPGLDVAPPRADPQPADPSAAGLHVALEPQSRQPGREAARQCRQKEEQACLASRSHEADECLFNEEDPGALIQSIHRQPRQGDK